MREKKWTDCPSCGSIKSMKYKRKAIESYNIKNYGKLKISGLDGYFCRKCMDGVFTKNSQKIINSKIAEFKASIDAKKVVAADLISVSDMAKKLNKTKQAIHKMMNEGRLKYVYAAGLKLPVKNQKN